MASEQKRAKRVFGVPVTLLVILVIFVLWGGSYVVVDQMRAMRLGDMNKCIAEDASGIFNSCDSKIVLTICTGTGTDKSCVRETLEKLQYFTPEDAAPTGIILGERFACSAPNIAYVSYPEDAPETGADACRAPD